MSSSTGRVYERRARLQAQLEANPLLTDTELARMLGVSVQTVRLDRQALGIPQVRNRMLSAARRWLRPETVDALDGQLRAVEPGQSALAVFSEPVGGTVPSGESVLFARAEALALAAAGMKGADIETVKVHFATPVSDNGPDPLVGQGEVLRRPTHEKAVVLVTIRSGSRSMLRAKFMVRVSAVKETGRGA